MITVVYDCSLYYKSMSMTYMVIAVTSVDICVRSNQETIVDITSGEL